MKKPKDPMVFVGHIRDAILDIESHLRGVPEKNFYGDVKTQDAVARKLMVIGEASKNVSLGFRKKHPHIDWEGQAGLRDVIVHDYFNLDLEVIWDIVIRLLPGLKTQVEKILVER